MAHNEVLMRHNLKIVKSRDAGDVIFADDVVDAFEQLEAEVERLVGLHTRDIVLLSKIIGLCQGYLDAELVQEREK